MTLRLFKCTECGHRMRFGRDICGRCYAPKLLVQRPLSLGVFVLASIAASLAVMRLG